MDFRQYNPALGRFNSIDPVTHFSMSTYTAFDNNPVYWSDPSGADSQDNGDPDPPDPEKIQEYQYDMNNPDDVNFLEELAKYLGWNLHNLDEVIVVGGKNDNDEYDDRDWLDFEISEEYSYIFDFLDITSEAIQQNSLHHSKTYSATYGTRTMSANDITIETRSSMNSLAKNAGRANVAFQLVDGSISIYKGVQKDGGQFGQNAQTATASTVGSMAGGWAGAEAGAAIGAAIGVWFGGVGAAPGALIGGIIGGFVGAYTGSVVGEASVDYYYKKD